MKKISLWRNRRGIAIESAIFTLLLVFSLCTMIVMISMFMRQTEKRETDDFYERIAIDRVGEDFLYAIERHDAILKTSGEGDNATTYLADKESGISIFDPVNYGQVLSSKNKVFSVTVSASGGFYIMKITKETTHITPAVYDEEGLLLRPESQTVVKSHLLTVSAQVSEVDGVRSCEITQWSYID